MNDGKAFFFLSMNSQNILCSRVKIFLGKWKSSLKIFVKKIKLSVSRGLKKYITITISSLNYSEFFAVSSLIYFGEKIWVFPQWNFPPFNSPPIARVEGHKFPFHFCKWRQMNFKTNFASRKNHFKRSSFYKIETKNFRIFFEKNCCFFLKKLFDE